MQESRKTPLINIYVCFGENRNHRRTRLVIIGALSATAIALLYHLLWWDRFLAARAGHGLVMVGQMIVEGEVPHRDFFMPATPLQFLKSALLYYWFGASLAAPLVMAVCERVLMAGVLYCWLVR